MYLFAKKLRRSQEKNIFWTIFSLKNDEQMSKRQKPAKIFLCPPNTTYPTNIIQGKEKKLESFEETPPSSQLNASCEKMEEAKAKRKGDFFRSIK